MTAAAVLTGVIAGLGGVALTVLLHAVQHLAFGYTEDTFLVGVEQASAHRRILALGLGGGVVGVGWWLYRRAARRSISVTAALDSSTADLPVVSVCSDAILQIFAVGVGGSLGREGAPRQVGAAFGSKVGRLFTLPTEDRRVLLAAGAGGGLAAMYNVPFGGMVFALEALLMTVRPRAVVVVAISSLVATATAWPFLGDHPTYHLPPVHLDAQLVAETVVLGPLCAALALAFRAVMTRARSRAPRRWQAAVAIPAAFLAIGVIAARYPEVLGNGKGLAQEEFTGDLTTRLTLGLLLAKPLATWLCLRGGAIGGLLTPAFATGATLGVVVAQLGGEVGVSAQPAACAIVAAGAFLAVAQRIPVSAVILTLELTHPAPLIGIPIALCVAAAWVAERAITHRGSGRPHPSTQGT